MMNRYTKSFLFPSYNLMKLYEFPIDKITAHFHQAGLFLQWFSTVINAQKKNVTPFCNQYFIIIP